MEHIDLVDRLIPSSSQTLIVETPKGELVLVATERPPALGDTILSDDHFTAYRAGLPVTGVAFCVIRFL